MASVSTVEVIIGGKVLTIRGNDSEEYLQKVATYINNKVNEFNQNEAFRKMNTETKANYVYLNIADDYFKAKRRCDELSNDMDARDKEVYNLKHEIIEWKLKCEAYEKEIDKLKAENSRFQKSIVKYELDRNGKNN